MNLEIQKTWMSAIGDEFDKPYFKRLEEFVDGERASFPDQVYPREDEVFSAFQLTPYKQVNVLLLGQDPYVGKDQAHGLCFSVRPGIKPPPSVQNIFKELRDDLGCRIPNNGYLVPWARQGVLMLNTILTVRAGQPFSHRGKGWEEFTNAVIRKVNEKKSLVVFVLWGGPAKENVKFIDTDRHPVVKAAHPSPLSARNGFFGSRPFSAINDALKTAGKPEIEWQIPDL